MTGAADSSTGNSTYKTPLYYSDPESMDPVSELDDLAQLEQAAEEAERATKIRESILLSVKDALGIVPEYTPFDNAIVMHINSTFATLFQLGIGPTTDQFHITGASETWTDFIADQTDVEFVRSYMYMKVRMLFDPPETATLFDAFGNQIKEMEWRLRVAGDENRLRYGVDELNN